MNFSDKTFVASVREENERLQAGRIKEAVQSELKSPAFIEAVAMAMVQASTDILGARNNELRHNPAPTVRDGNVAVDHGSASAVYPAIAADGRVRPQPSVGKPEPAAAISGKEIQETNSSLHNVRDRIREVREALTYTDLRADESRDMIEHLTTLGIQYAEYIERLLAVTNV